MRRLPGLLILVSTLAIATGPANAAGRQQISSDPFTNGDSQHATQVEPDTFAFGSTVVSAFQSGRFFDGGSSDIGFATSLDGGTTWTHGFLPSMTVNSTPAGPYARASDPAVAYDAKHGIWMIASLGINSSGAGLAVLVSRSKNGGTTWMAPVTVATTNVFYDKTWIVCDNSPASAHYGNCYATWDDAGQGDLLLASTSSDGGKTWGAPKPSKDRNFGLGGQPLVQPAGVVVVPYLSAVVNEIQAYRSKNGGKGWTATTTVSSYNDHGVAGNLRTEPLPSAEIDADGKVYVVWQDCRFRASCSSNDIVMSTSSNGSSWSSPVRIPIDPVSSTVDHFIPGLGVDRTSSGSTARLALTYYFYPNANCSQSTCQLSVGFVSSTDGGASWTAPITLAGPMSLNDLANTTSGLMVGDYISTSFAGANAVSVFALARPKQGSVFDEAMYSTMQPVSALDSHPLLVTADPVLSTTSDRPRRTQILTTP
jgi:hypothetical protein